MEKKFTPGPWTIQGISMPTYYGNSKVEACGAVELSIGTTMWFSDDHPVKTLEEAESNAKLCIASMKLLEALEDSFMDQRARLEELKLSGVDKDHNLIVRLKERINASEAAIKKAYGL